MEDRHDGVQVILEPNSENRHLRGTIYVIENQLPSDVGGKKIYIGQTSLRLTQRWHKHVAMAQAGRSTSHLYAAVRKYGVDNFGIRALMEEVFTDQLLRDAWLDDNEQEMILRLQALNPLYGYNLHGGGHRRWKHAEETKVKMREWKLAHNATAEGKRDLMNGIAGVRAAWDDPLGRARIIAAQLEGNQSPLAREHRSQAQKARFAVPAERERIRLLRIAADTPEGRARGIAKLKLTNRAKRKARRLQKRALGHLQLL
jgi:group I intron endonuclease